MNGKNRMLDGSTRKTNLVWHEPNIKNGDIEKSEINKYM